jgi:tight adherence protein C
MSEQLYPYIMMGATFLSFALLTYGLAAYSAKRRAMRDRYRGVEDKNAPLLQGWHSSSSFKKRFLDWVSHLGKFTLKTKGEKPEEARQLKSTLFQAGFRHPNAPSIYFGLRTICAFLLPLPFMFLNIWRGKSAFTIVMFAFLLAAAGYFLPSYVLKVSLRRRQDRLDRVLPDVLDLMIVCMEAGLALQATLARVSEEIKSLSKDLHNELQITTGELRAGLPRETALKNLAERTGVQSIKSLVSLMVQSERMGTSIAEALRTQSDYIRVQRAQRAEEIAAKLPVKIIFPMMLFIMPALFIVILGPGAINISRNLLK